MKKALLKRYNESKETEAEPPVKRMKTRSMTKKEKSVSFDKAEYEKYHNNREEYDKEQERRRLAGIKPVIICMGGPYSDAWYPPHN
tara:strand:- start:267 stop:524 length:258 start_codon:yes stop_codon:yes gene_type:complete